jgi:hypothetical protein
VPVENHQDQVQKKKSKEKIKKKRGKIKSYFMSDSFFILGPGLSGSRIEL